MSVATNMSMQTTINSATQFDSDKLCHCNGKTTTKKMKNDCDFYKISVHRIYNAVFYMLYFGQTNKCNTCKRMGHKSESTDYPLLQHITQKINLHARQVETVCFEIHVIASQGK